MSLFIASLNSGSNGNCYYVGNDTEAVLIDAGISCRETERRMKRLDLAMQKVKAIFISHEHIDHISGVATLSKKHQLPVYITPATLSNSFVPVEKHLLNHFEADKPVKIGGLTVKAFTKSHDAADPHSFIIIYKKLRVGVFTDIGEPCRNIKKYFPQCHAAFLETNYCEDMLEKGRYPVYLKRRISGNKGHLSNTQALDLFVNHRGSHLAHLFLSHLSKNNNSPELVNELFNKQAGNTQIIVASRYRETSVIRLDDDSHTIEGKGKAPHRPRSRQLSLFQ